jgi:hypothetical protein
MSNMTYSSSRLLVPILTTIIFLFSFVYTFAATQSGAQLQNPLSAEFDDISRFIAGALRILVMVALPIITLFFVYSGFMFVTAQGNPGKLSEAKKNFIWVVIGALLIMSAWIIATLIGGTVSQLTGGL